MALEGLRLDAGDAELGLLQRGGERLGLGAGANVETVDLLAVGADEAGGERRAGLGLEMGEDRPIFAGDEFLDLEFAVADDPQRHRLHSAGRARARQLAQPAAPA